MMATESSSSSTQHSHGWWYLFRMMHSTASVEHAINHDGCGRPYSALYWHGDPDAAPVTNRSQPRSAVIHECPGALGPARYLPRTQTPVFVTTNHGRVGCGTSGEEYRFENDMGIWRRHTPRLASGTALRTGKTQNYLLTPIARQWYFTSIAG